MTYAEYRNRWELLSAAQKERVRDKARWEGCGLFAVAQDWPNLFDADESVSEREREEGE